MKPFRKLCISGRSSALSRAQVQEVLGALREFHEIEFEPIWVETHGDKDRASSLRTMGKTDFFTREVDALVLSGEARVAIHSAKDLPEVLPVGLRIAVVTKGLDPRDCVVLRDGDVMRAEMLVATSSERREEMVRNLCRGVRFCDVRGTIEERLRKLWTGDVDGVVVAEAALIRLGLTGLNRVFLAGETAEGQGRLAVVCREGDEEMIELYKCLETVIL